MNRRTDNTIAKREEARIQTITNKQIFIACPCNDLQNATEKTKYWVIQTPQKRMNSDLCSGRISSSCSTIGTSRVNYIKNPVKHHKMTHTKIPLRQNPSKIQRENRKIKLFWIWLKFGQLIFIVILSNRSALKLWLPDLLREGEIPDRNNEHTRETSTQLAVFRRLETLTLVMGNGWTDFFCLCSLNKLV